MTAIATPVVTLYASAARTATPTADTVPAQGRLRAHFVLDVTAGTAGFSVTPTIDAYDPVSTKWYNTLTGLAITTTGTTVLKIGPGLTAVANACAVDVLPAQFRLVMTHADAKSITYSVAAHLYP